MIDHVKIIEILNGSPSVELLKNRNREFIITFLVSIFPNQQGTISSENIHNYLSDFLEDRQIENDEDNLIEIFDTYEIKAKKHLQNWTNKGFLTNYQDENGDIFYELSSYSIKTIDWISSLKKEEYVGTESKFKNIFSQLKELVEFTNDDIEKRVRLLEDKKLEIEQQIERITNGEDIKVFEEFEIVPRFNQLNQSAKELLSDFKEVEDNFKEITKAIYQKHADGSLSKSDILDFTFEALDELKDSQQGKSFYAFWSFLLNPGLQAEWKDLTDELYKTLGDRGIVVNDSFLKGMKKHLHASGQKVYKANDKMAEKLSRIIRENEASKSEATKSIIQDIKKALFEISKSRKRPEISFTLETDFEIQIPFERRLTFEQSEDVSYKRRPVFADTDIVNSDHVHKLFQRSYIDKDILRKRIIEVLRSKSQTTIQEVIATNGGIEKGLPELFGYIGVIKDFKYSISSEKFLQVNFDKVLNKSIKIPEIILTR